MQAEVLSRINVNHLWVESSIQMAKEVLFWLDMKKANQDMCSTYGIAIAKSIPLPLLPWQIISQDLSAFEQRSYLVTVCHISEWVKVHELTNRLSITIVKRQMKNSRDFTSHEFVTQTMDYK